MQEINCSKEKSRAPSANLEILIQKNYQIYSEHYDMHKNDLLNKM